MLRLFVSDVDRTILTHNYELPDIVIASFEKLRNAGVRTVLATARSPAAVKPYAERLGTVETAICFNGGWIGNLETNQASYSRPVSRELAIEVMDLAQSFGLTPLWYGNDCVYSYAGNSLAEREAKITGESLFLVLDKSDFPGCPGKLLCVRKSQDDNSFDRLREHFAGRLTIVQSHWRLLEMGAFGTSKRSAMERVALGWNFPPASCAAAGDAENDFEMMAWAGRRITVENAVAEVKQIAQFIGPSCDLGGIASAINWLVTQDMLR